MRVGSVNGVEVWNYAAGTPLTKGDGVGELVAGVPRAGRPALGAMPMTGEQLAAMATDPSLKPE